MFTFQDWWNATNLASYYRTWNVVVHDWLYTYVYRDAWIVSFSFFLLKFAKISNSFFRYSDGKGEQVLLFAYFSFRLSSTSTSSLSLFDFSTLSCSSNFSALEVRVSNFFFRRNATLIFSLVHVHDWHEAIAPRLERHAMGQLIHGHWLIDVSLQYGMVRQDQLSTSLCKSNLRF